MKRHLYNSKLSKFVWFANRFGVLEMIRKPLRIGFAPLIIPRLPKRTISFQGEELECFYHRYNMTWACERCLEIPIGQFYLRQFRDRKVLEVGNVLSHYFPVDHDILDKFEKGPRIINRDISEFVSPERFDLVLSISTFEHIGFDDETDVSSDKRILAAVAACRTVLQPHGKLVITVPIGYNPQLDWLIREQGLGTSAEFYFARTAAIFWQPTGRDEALRRKYRRPFPYANAIMVAEFGSAD